MSARKVFSGLCCLGLGALFVAASVPKLLEPEAFALAVSRYHVVEGVLVNVAAIALPWVELAAGVAALPFWRWQGGRRLRLAGLLTIGGMLVVFTGAIAMLLAAGETASCGCFSTRADASSSGGWNVARNVGLLALTAFAAWTEAGPRPEEGGAGRGRMSLRKRFEVPSP